MDSKPFFVMGAFIDSSKLNMAVVQNTHISLYEKEINLSVVIQEEIDQEIYKFLKEVGLKLHDLERINIFCEVSTDLTAAIVNHIKEFAKQEGIKVSMITSADWILSSNWIYSFEEIQKEKIDEYKPPYPYITAFSTKDSFDFVLSNEETDTRLIGSSNESTPELLLEQISNFLKIDTEIIDQALLEGDTESIAFDVVPSLDFNLEISQIYLKAQAQYSHRLKQISSFKSDLRDELQKNLKADILSSSYEEIFDQINTKLFAIADTFGIKNISLVGDIWLIKRLQEKLIRLAAVGEFILKFPAEANTFPRAAFVAGYK